MQLIPCPRTTVREGAGEAQRVSPSAIGSGVWRRNPKGGRQLHRAEAATIVEYTDRKQPQNDYPVHIVSPLLPARCCASDMVDVGDPQTDGPWIFQYRRCTMCGFTVRRFLGEIPDPSRFARLRATLKSSFVRNTE